MVMKGGNLLLNLKNWRAGQTRTIAYELFLIVYSLKTWDLGGIKHEYAISL
jgi:hypothetical protein